MGLHDEARLDRKFVEFAKLMNIHLNHFPKHEKYGLALEIRRAAYAVYGFIVEGQKRYHKKTALSNLDVEHEKLRMLVRLAFELGYFEFKDGKRFVRRHSLYTFRSALKRGRMQSAVSVLGHARFTHSLQHMLRHLKEHHHAYHHQLPKAYRRPDHPRAAVAGRRESPAPRAGDRYSRWDYLCQPA